MGPGEPGLPSICSQACRTSFKVCSRGTSKQSSSCRGSALIFQNVPTMVRGMCRHLMEANPAPLKPEHAQLAPSAPAPPPSLPTSNPLPATPYVATCRDPRRCPSSCSHSTPPSPPSPRFPLAPPTPLSHHPTPPTPLASSPAPPPPTPLSSPGATCSFMMGSCIIPCPPLSPSPALSPLPPALWPPLAESWRLCASQGVPCCRPHAPLADSAD